MSWMWDATEPTPKYCRLHLRKLIEGSCPECPKDPWPGALSAGRTNDWALVQTDEPDDAAR